MSNLGEVVVDWAAPAYPDIDVLDGTYCRLERLNLSHAQDLFASYAENKSGDMWDYMPYGPFADVSEYQDWVETQTQTADPRFFAIYSYAEQRFCGVASYLRITPDSGTIEVGHISLAPSLQKTPAATEAIYLMMRWAFEAGYRRFEWKCNALNIGSRKAAQRFGFSYEGVFRQALIVKNRNRDTAWFAMIDKEWPALQIAFQSWLDPSNFTTDGKQKISLCHFTAPILAANDPISEINYG